MNNAAGNAPSREREPELKEVLTSLELLSSRFDDLTLNLKGKIQSIYNPPELEPQSKTTDNKEPANPNDMVGFMNEQINRLKICHDRLEGLLGKLNKII